MILNGECKDRKNWMDEKSPTYFFLYNKKMNYFELSYNNETCNYNQQDFERLFIISKFEIKK